MKPRKPIRKVSRKKAASDKLYRARVKVWLEGKTCAVFGSPATEVHHSRGRLSSLKMDERFWVAVSPAGHRYIHDNPEWARKSGLICEKGLWNKPV